MTEYDEGRIWYRKKGKIVTVGLTEKAFEEIGEAEEILLPSDGDELTQDDVIGEVTGTKTSFEIISPVDGQIVAVNDALTDDVDLLVQDPLDEGWVCQIRVVNVDRDGDDDEE